MEGLLGLRWAEVESGQFAAVDFLRALVVGALAVVGQGSRLVKGALRNRLVPRMTLSLS